MHSIMSNNCACVFPWGHLLHDTRTTAKHKVERQLHGTCCLLVLKLLNLISVVTTAPVDTVVLGKFQAACISKTTAELTS